MLTSRKTMLGAATLVALFAVPQLAEAAVTTTTANLNLRRGPGTNHRVITTIPAGSRVDIHSCGKTWCYLSWAGHRGFSNGFFLINHVTVAVSPLHHLRHW